MDSAGVSLQSQNGFDYATQMKELAKQRLRRQVLQDPGKAAELVKIEATSTYNVDADLVQSARVSLGVA